MIAAGVARAYREAFSGLPRAIWLLAGATFVNRSGSMVLPFLSLYFSRELGFGAAGAGRLLALYGLGSMAGSYFGGWLCDRIPARRVQELSLVGTGGGFLLMSQLRSFAALAAAVVIVSMIADAFRPAMFVSVARHAEPRVRPRAFGLIRLAVNLGMAIGPALGGLLATRSYALLFVGDALTCWAAAGVLAVALRRFPEPGPLSDPDGHPGEASHSPWRDAPFLGFLILVVVLAAIFFQVFVTLPIDLKAGFGFSEPSIGLLFALNAIMIVAFEMILLRSVEHRNPVRVTAVGTAVLGLGLAMLALGHAPWLAIASTVAWTVGEMLVLPMTNTIVAARAGTAGAGRYMGAYTLAFSSAFVVAPLAGTAVLEGFGASALWLGVGALALALAAGFGALAPVLR